MCKEAQMQRWQDAKEPSKRDLSMIYTEKPGSDPGFSAESNHYVTLGT